MAQNRTNNLGTLHLIGAFLVLLGHQYILLGQNPPLVLGIHMHSMGVKVIFLISGYFIVKSLWSRPDEKRLTTAKRFWIKRLGRLYPEYAFYVFASALIVGPFVSNLPIKEYLTHIGTASYIARNLRLYICLGLPEVFAGNPYAYFVNGSIWTIPVEIVGYFFVWFLYTLSSNQKVKKFLYITFTGLLIVLYFLRMEFFVTERLDFYATEWLAALNLWPYFFVGGLFHILDLKKYLNTQLAVVLLFLFSCNPFAKDSVKELVILFLLAYFIFSLAFEEKQRIKIPFLHSEYAYGIYLWGFFIQQVMIHFWVAKAGLPVNHFIFFLVSAILTYLIGMFSNKIVYKPISKLLNKLL